MAQYGHLSELDAQECRSLLRSQSFGRVGWAGPEGVQILPVAYVLDGDLIVFRTQEGTQLAQLAEPMDVSFQIDDLDSETRTGWSVLVTGRSTRRSDTGTDIPQPWAPGDRALIIGIEPVGMTGRSVAAN